MLISYITHSQLTYESKYLGKNSTFNDLIETEKKIYKDKEYLKIHFSKFLEPYITRFT